MSCCVRCIFGGKAGVEDKKAAAAEVAAQQQAQFMLEFLEVPGGVNKGF